MLPPRLVFVELVLTQPIANAYKILMEQTVSVTNSQVEASASVLKILLVLLVLALLILPRLTATASPTSTLKTVSVEKTQPVVDAPVLPILTVKAVFVLTHHLLNANAIPTLKE